MRVCYFGTYRTGYNRNEIMMEGLRRAGVEVVECNEQLWRGIEDRVQIASGGWLNPAFWWRVLCTYLRLLRRYKSVGYYDVLIVGYPGQMDVFLARFLSWLRRKPLVWDILMSIYLVALERGLDKRSSITINMLRWIEKVALRLPDMLIQDTPEYINWLRLTHGVSLEKFRLVPIGADERIFQPSTKSQAARKGTSFRVVYYGTFIPNHGVEYIVEAARLLSNDQSIQFDLIGSGPDQGKARSLAASYHLSNVHFMDWMEKSELVKQAQTADILLGTFGATPQSVITVHNKVYEGLAMSKAVITGDSPAVRQVMRHGEHIYLCKRENPQALAEAILELKENPSLRNRLSTQGYALYRERFTTQKLGSQLKQYLAELTGCL